MTAVSTTFLTARAAARHMIPRGSGVILMFGGTGPPLRDYYIGGTQVALGAIDLMRQQLAAELGPHGIRVVTLRSGGVPESLPEDTEGREGIIERTIVSQTMLGRAATLRGRRQRRGVRRVRPSPGDDRRHRQHQLRRAGGLIVNGPCRLLLRLQLALRLPGGRAHRRPDPGCRVETDRVRDSPQPARSVGTRAGRSGPSADRGGDCRARWGSGPAAVRAP